MDIKDEYKTQITAAGHALNENGRKITNKLIELFGSNDFTIAFLPYKKSMWNCMESVYEECKAAGAETHVMPIPYWRMKENMKPDFIDSDFDAFGSIAENVRNLPDIDPDFLVVHYPFDNHNKVTQMLPEFHLKNLKAKYPDARLVYIPYYIATGKKGFRIHSGIQNVDLIFLHTEWERDACIAEWEKVGIDFRGRVFAFGSPKVDAAFKAMDNAQVPQEWQQALNGLPVTLVLNSLESYLLDPLPRIETYKQYIMREVNKGNAVIFRLHPLLKTTIKSMWPESEPAFDRFIKEISRLPHVVVDDTEELERTLGISDYLISDKSSVVPMWQATGKPFELML